MESTARRISPLDSALSELTHIIGGRNVSQAEAAQRSHGDSTIVAQRRIAGVVFPRSTLEVQRIVHVANKHNVPLYPISLGGNWGYGSALPVTDDCIVVDLAQMNQVCEVNEELAYAVVEPGVSQMMLHKHLQQQNSRLRIDPSGAGPDVSILGNILERGLGIGRYGDHFSACAGMEVVLPTGEVLQTGFGGFPNTSTSHIHKWGIGPYLDGIFTQSNLGIVTKVGVWLQPKPEHFEACIFRCDKLDGIAALVDETRKLMQSDAVLGPINLVSLNRLLVPRTQYPWQEMDNRTPLSRDVQAQLAKRYDLPTWLGIAPLHGTYAQVEAAKQCLLAHLKPLTSRIDFINDTTESPASPLLMRFLKGEPNDVSLSLAYWRNRRVKLCGQKMHPAKDGCGLIWFSPVIPMTGGHIAKFIGLIQPIFDHYKLESCPTFTALHGRSICCTLPILFNRDDATETQNAKDCYEALLTACQAEGILPYRIGIQTMEKFWGGDFPLAETVRRLKAAFDPNNILAPGRYCGG